MATLGSKKEERGYLIIHWYHGFNVAGNEWSSVLMANMRRSNSTFKKSDDSMFSSYNAFVYVYVLVMTAMFCYQAWLSIDKFLEGEVRRFLS